MSRRKHPVFYGRELLPEGHYWKLDWAEAVTVVCWSSYQQPKRIKTGLEPAKLVWSAKLVGRTADTVIIIAHGRTPREALRNLERQTLKMVRTFVKTFAAVFASIGRQLVRITSNSEKLPRLKKK